MKRALVAFALVLALLCIGSGAIAAHGNGHHGHGGHQPFGALLWEYVW